MEFKTKYGKTAWINSQCLRFFYPRFAAGCTHLAVVKKAGGVWKHKLFKSEQGLGLQHLHCTRICGVCGSREIGSCIQQGSRALPQECCCVKKVTRITKDRHWPWLLVPGGWRSFTACKEALMRRYPSRRDRVHLSLARAGQTEHDSLLLNGQASPLVSPGPGNLVAYQFQLV